MIGRYRDDDEDYPLVGAIKEVMLCPHAVGAEDIAAHFEADKSLADAAVGHPARPAVRRRAVPAIRHAHQHDRDVGDGGPVHRDRRVRHDLPADRRAAKVEKPDTMGEVVLGDLEPGTKYFYRVVCTDAEGRKLESKPLTFTDRAGAGRRLQLRGHRRHAAEPGQ